MKFTSMMALVLAMAAPMPVLAQVTDAAVTAMEEAAIAARQAAGQAAAAPYLGEVHSAVEAGDGSAGATAATAAINAAAAAAAAATGAP